MIIFCAVYSITASSPPSFSSAPLQSLSLHIMDNGNRHVFIHPDPKVSFVASVSTHWHLMHYANTQIQHVSNMLTPVLGLFSHSLSFLLTLPCALLAGTMANMAFLLHTLPKDRTCSLFVSLHPLLHSSFWVSHLSVESFLQSFCFLLGHFGLLHPYPHPHRFPQ